MLTAPCLHLKLSMLSKWRLLRFSAPQGETMELPRVLIVEDEPDNQAIVRAVVEEMVGARAILAGDGLEAISVATREVPDLVLLDLMLPRLD